MTTTHLLGRVTDSPAGTASSGISPGRAVEATTCHDSPHGALGKMISVGRSPA